jgi:hypothetical protein
MKVSPDRILPILISEASKLSSPLSPYDMTIKQGFSLQQESYSPDRISTRFYVSIDIGHTPILNTASVYKTGKGVEIEQLTAGT